MALMNKIIIAALLIVSLPMMGCGAKLGDKGLNNEFASANLRLGVAYLERGEYEQALEKLNRALESDPKYALAYSVRGFLYQRIGEKRKAEKNYKKALSLDKSNSELLNNYGQFLCSDRRYDDAHKIFLQAASNPLYSTPETALTNAGICAIADGKLAMAEKQLRRALQKNPKFPVALLHMAHLSYQRGKDISARAHLQRYLENSSPTPDSLWLGIRIERKLGDKNALASYELLLRNKFADSNEAGLLENSSK